MSKENVISKKEPFARMVKRDHISVGKAWAIRLIAVALSLVVAALVIVAVTKQNPIEVYLGIIDGAVGSNRRIWVTIREMMVLLCIAIGLTPAFKMKFWNIGAEGQILMGGTAAAAMMIYFGEKMPNWLLLIVIFVVSGLAGLIWGVIPAIFKAYFNTNETLFTLMLNYVAMQIVTFCIVFWENPSGSNTVGIINAATKGGWFPTIFGNAYTLNVIIVLAITLVVYVYMKYSKQGYEISVVGESQNTARYAGIDVKKVIIRTMMISGAICGIAGAVIVSGASHTISTSTAGGRGFTAIIVAWMSKFNPLAMILVSGFLVFMQQGSIQVASQFGLNENASDIITGILLFFLIGCELLLTFIQKAIGQGVAILFGASGEIVTEKSGNLNLGIPGIMYMGGIAGLMGAFFYEKSTETPNGAIGVLVSLLCSLIASALGGLIYSFLTITLRANQNVVGLALTTFGVGFGNFFGGSISKLAGGVGQISVQTTAAAYRTTIPGLSKIPVIGTLFFSYGFLTYLSVIVAVVMTYFLKKTRKGLNLRAVGESPATADAAGINVSKYKYAATVTGAAIAGLGGLYFVMEYLGGTWSNNGFGDRGWLAIALVILALWNPDHAIWGSFVFGGLYILYIYLPGLNRATQELVKMLPYVVTIIVLIITSKRNKQENQPPASLGEAYFREDR